MTPATDAGRVARAREIAWKLVIGKKVGGGDGQTYVGRTPTVREVEAALLAFADTEAASQPREGDGLLEALDEALKQYTEPMSMMNSHELGERLANDVAEIVRHSRARAALTQRPPEQAGAVPAGWKLAPMEPTSDMIEAARGMFPRPAYVAMLSAAPTPPDAGPGEIPAGMVAWHGGDSAPADWDGQEAMRRDGRREKPRRWFHDPVHPYADIIAYSPKAPPQTPPDAGIGSDGAGEVDQRVAYAEGALWQAIQDNGPPNRLLDYVVASLGHLSDGLSDTKSSWAEYATRLYRETSEKVDAFRLDQLSHTVATQPGDGGRS